MLFLLFDVAWLLLWLKYDLTILQIRLCDINYKHLLACEIQTDLDYIIAFMGFYDCMQNTIINNILIHLLKSTINIYTFFADKYFFINIISKNYPFLQLIISGMHINEMIQTIIYIMYVNVKVINLLAISTKSRLILDYIISFSWDFLRLYVEYSHTLKKYNHLFEIYQ